MHSPQWVVWELNVYKELTQCLTCSKHSVNGHYHYIVVIVIIIVISILGNFPSYIWDQGHCSC